MNLSEFISRWNGKGLDFDGVYGFQCKDLANEWGKEIGHLLPAGNAVDMAFRNIPGYTWITNASGNHPEEGDIVVWGTRIGTFGHIGVSLGGATTDHFSSFDQNWPLGSVCHVQAHTYYGVAGWLRPAGYSSAPAPAPSEPVIGQVTVTVPVLNVHKYFGDAGNFANTPDGKLHQGTVFSYTGVMEGPDPYSDGRKYWLITTRHNTVWAGGTSLVQPSAPAPAPAPTPAPEPVPEPPSNTGAPVIESASPGPVEPTVVPVDEPPAVDSVSTPAKETRIIPPARVITTEVVFVYDLQTEKAVAKIPKGRTLDLIGMTTLRGKNFFRASVDGHEWSPNHVVAPYYLEQMGGTSVKLDHIANPIWKSILRFLHVIH